MNQLFSSQQHAITPGAQDVLDSLSLPPRQLLERHFAGDWSEMDPEDQEANRQSLADGSRILSAYRLPGTGEKVWVITEAVGDDGKRSVTTILLPEEY